MSAPPLRALRYGDEWLRFSVRVQPARKVPRIAIHVEPDGRVVVDAPQDADEMQLLAAVRRRAAWISRCLAQIRLRPRAADAAPLQAAPDAFDPARARELLSARLDAVAALLPWVGAPPPLRLRAMRRQWGNCSPAGRLTLNPHLAKAPRECIDYVILHELCHLKEHHHGPRFHRLLDACMPGWREVKQRLDGLVDQLLPLR